MAQEWITIDESIDLAAFFSTDHPSLRSMALFDAIINNTDRKIGHLLPFTFEKIYGCDHGVTFHVDDKLRTVLWQWSQAPFTDEEVKLLAKTDALLAGELGAMLTPYLTQEEIAATQKRISRLILEGRFGVR
jgi:uncharacterized repeat protein (TIGR03843 family)